MSKQDKRFNEAETGTTQFRAAKTKSAKSGGRKERSGKKLALPRSPDSLSEAPVSGAQASGSRLINRELSWLSFNERVLSEARDKENPLIERVRFLAITCSNLDEFFMVRVASLKDLLHAGYTRPDPSGMTCGEQLAAISERTHKMVARQYSTYSRALLPALERQGIRILKQDELNREQRDYLRDYFWTTVFPILTPMGVDAARPFPLISNRSLNLCLRVIRQDPEDTDPEDQFAIIQVPSVIPRLVPLPPDQHSYILLENVIRMHIDDLFGGVTIGPAGCFRIMRNADLDIDEEDAADLLIEIEKQIKLRQWGEVIRLEIEDETEPELIAWLSKTLRIDNDDLYPIDGPLDLTFLNQLASREERPELRYPRYIAPNPLADESDDLFAAIRRRDILLYHPFDSFEPIIDLLRQAAHDPDVLAIKQTLYRVSGNSPIIRSLAEAAENGKQVMVLVELKARFDEENNIQWARRLERAGCHVIYGLVGLKTHSKITLIVRRDEDRIRRYIHLGTGNYNDITARVYTDLGLLTCSEVIGQDASAFFNMLSGYSAPPAWNRLIPAPIWLRRDLLRRIDREIHFAESGQPARIILKTNALVDEEMIDALYRASAAGVRIDLIVRGICCLRPGVPGLSENITVRSIVGRFLEHARIFYFYHDGREDLFLSSADWMPRNLDRRVELMFPLEDRDTRAKVMEILQLQLVDTKRSHLMQADGTYEKIDRRGKASVDCQVELCMRALTAAQAAAEAKSEFRFEPIEQAPEDQADSRLAIRDRRIAERRLQEEEAGKLAVMPESEIDSAPDDTLV